MRLNSALALVGGLALATAISAQPPQPSKAPPAATYVYPTPLYRMNDVSKSLNLTADQITRLNKLTDDT